MSTADTLWLAIGVPVAVAMIGTLLRPVRRRTVAIFRAVRGRPYSELRLVETGVAQSYWDWSPQPNGTHCLVCTGRVQVTNDGNRVNSPVKGTVRQIGLRPQGRSRHRFAATFAPQLEMWTVASPRGGQWVGAHDLKPDATAQIHFIAFTGESRATEKPHNGPMRCRVTLEDRFGHKHHCRMTLAETPRPSTTSTDVADDSHEEDSDAPTP